VITFQLYENPRAASIDLKHITVLGLAITLETLQGTGLRVGPQMSYIVVEDDGRYDSAANPRLTTPEETKRLSLYIGRLR